MNSVMRFGRKMSMPSTVQIKHELRLMMAADRIADLKKQLAEIQDAEGGARAELPAAGGKK